MGFSQLLVAAWLRPANYVLDRASNRTKRGIGSFENTGHLKIAERMAENMGDSGFDCLCREWFKEGSDSMETKMWTGSYYLNFWEPETGKKSTLVFRYQLDGQWIVR